MGWENAHLHQFVIGDQYYGIPSEDDAGPRQARDEWKYKLSDVVLGERSQFRYDYEFGDNCVHLLVVEKMLPPEEAVRYPICLAGARSSPPEDVGGIPGYEDFLEAIRDPKHPEHQEFSEWIGGTFDPEAFNVDEINRLLRATR